ncbi:sulfurtransferase TusA family protein [candidate division KSB1 bacterium]
MNISTSIDSTQKENTESNLLEIKPDEIVNLEGVRCPMAMLKAKKAIDTAKTGQVLEIISPEFGTRISVPWLSKRKDNKFLGVLKTGSEYHYFMKKA